MNQKNQNETGAQKTAMILWIVTGLLLLALLFARVIYPEFLWLSVITGLPLLVGLGALVTQNQKALKSRGAAYGLNSLVTIALVIGIVGVLDFLTSRYPLKWDLTKNKVHTLSDQSVKLIKGLKKPVKAVFFSKLSQKDQVHSLLDNYQALNPKFEVEYVDPDREPTRAKQAGIKKYGTLLVNLGARENKIEDPTEEKLTNSLIKLLKDKTTVLCTVTGHGEKNFSSQEADGYDAVKKLLTEQAYELKELNIVQEGKIPDSCDGIAVIGPNKPFFAPEIKAIRSYLEAGGRAVVAMDMNLKGTEFSPELLPVLKEWNVQANPDLIVDPLSRMLGVDASVAILASFSKDHVITKDFQGNCFFPFSRSLQIIPAAPPSLHVQWIAQTTPKSWAVADLNQLAKGEVRFHPGKDKQGSSGCCYSHRGKTEGLQIG